MKTPEDRGISDCATPFHCAIWRRLAGSDGTAIALSSASNDLHARVRSSPDHYYHHPSTLVAGSREHAFIDSQDAKRWLDLDWNNAVTTVTPFGYRGGPLRAPVSPEKSEECAKSLIDAARSQQCCAVLSHFLFDDEDSLWIDALLRQGGEFLTLGAQARLRLDFNSMEGYYAKLGPSRRSLRSRGARECDGATMSMISGPVRPELAEHITDLVLNHFSKFAGNAPPRGLIRMLALGRSLKRYLLLAGTEGELPRSALISIPWNATLYAKFFGSSVSRGDYFPLVYSYQISQALELGFRWIDFGGGAHQAKLFRGAQLRLARAVLIPISQPIADAMPIARRVSARKAEYFSTLQDRWERPPRKAAGPQGQTSLRQAESGLCVDA